MAGPGMRTSYEPRGSAGRRIFRVQKTLPNFPTEPKTWSQNSRKTKGILSFVHTAAPDATKRDASAARYASHVRTCTYVDRLRNSGARAIRHPTGHPQAREA